MCNIDTLILELETLVNQARRSPEFSLLLESLPALKGKTVFDTLTSVPDIILIEYPTLYQVKKSLKEKFKNETDAFFNLEGTHIEKIIKFLNLEKSTSAEVDTVFVEDQNRNYDKQLMMFESVTELIPNKYKQNVGKINISLLNKNIPHSYAAYNKDGNKSINLSLNSKDDIFLSEIAHEYGHLLEEFNPIFKKESWRFINKRILKDSNNKPLEKDSIAEIFHDQDEDYDLSKYADISVYRGFFITPYLGRTYGDIENESPTEVISIGLQSLFLDPVAFLFKDIGHFEIIYNLLKGNYNVD